MVTFGLGQETFEARFAAGVSGEDVRQVGGSQMALAHFSENVTEVCCQSQITALVQLIIL